MTTFATIRDRIVSRAQGPRAQVRDKQSGSLTASGTSVVVTYDRPDIGPDSVLEWPDGDLAFVWAEASASTYTIERGHRGVTATAHVDGEIITINPRWTKVDVWELMQEEVASWPEAIGVEEEIFIDVDGSSDVVELDVSGNLSRLGTVRRTDGLGIDWESVDVVPIRSDEFGSQWGIQLGSCDRTAGTLAVWVVYKPTVSALTTASTFCFSENMMDVLILGTLWRMMSTQEIGRTDDVGFVNARNEAVPPTYLTQASEYFRTIRDQRIMEEKARVYNNFPLVMKDLA